MNVVRRLTCLLVIVALLGDSATAGQDPEQAAVDGLLAAGPEGARAEPSEEALSGLLSETDREPWLLVEHLLARGRQDVAVRLARKTSEELLGPLLAYAEAQDAATGAAERARALSAASALRESEGDEAALRRLEAFDTPPGRPSVFRVQALALRADCLEGLGRRAASIEARLGGAEEALQIGWWAAAELLFWRGFEAGAAARNFDLAARAAEGSRAVYEIRGDGVRVAGAEQDLGTLTEARGDLPGALRHFDEALSRYESLGQADDAAEVRSLRSRVLAEIGDFRAALDDQRALALHHADRPHDAAWAANQVNLGLVRWRLGDEQGATLALTQALETYRAAGDTEGEAFAQGNLGLTHAMGGRWGEAIAAYRSALTLLQALGDALGSATAKHAVADALRSGAEADLRLADLAGEPAEREAARSKAHAGLAQAWVMLEEVLPILTDARAAGLACVATHTMGQIMLAQGQPQAALGLLEPARDEAGRLHAWHLRLAATVTLAQARLLLKDRPGALREARLASDELGRAFGGLAEADLARARALAPDVFDIGVSAARQTKSLDDLAYFLEAGRASALLRGLGGRAAALRATVPKPLAERLTASTRAKVAAFAAWQAARAQRPGEARELWKKYEALREAEQQALEETQRVQAEAANRLAPSRLVSIRELQARLRSTARPGLRQVFALFNFQRTEAVALVVEESAARVVSYTSEVLDPLRAAFATLSASRRGELDTAALATVRRLLIDPLEIPAGPTRLFVCPDRDLAYVPLCAIVPDDWEIAWEPSATTYDLLVERRLRKGQGVLGLGDPDYGAVPDADALATRGGPRLLRLPGSRAEIETIAGKPEDRRLLFEEATESGFARALEAAGSGRSWRSVHLACHGLVDVEWPALSCLALTPGDGEDGFLMSNEVLRLPLRTDLAVLSACQTGRGAFVRGEGVMSLARAFMFAGAPRAIVSLWDVDDEATSFLMQAFYREWSAGRGTALALRLAQLAVRDREVEEAIEEPGKPPRQERRRPWADPKFWAAWALWGLAD